MPVLRLDAVPPLAPSCRIPHNVEGLGHRPACQKRSCWKFLKFHHDVRIRSQLAGCRTRGTVKAGIERDLGLAWTWDSLIYNLKQMFGALPDFVQILYWHGTSFNNIIINARRNQPKSAIRPSYLLTFIDEVKAIKAAFREVPGSSWPKTERPGALLRKTYPRKHKSDRKNPWRVCSGLVQGTCLCSYHVLLYNDCGARLSLGALHGHLTHFWLGQKLNNNLGVSTTSMSSVTFFYKFITLIFIFILVNCPIQC